MALTKEKKQKIVADLKDKISKHKAIVFISITGLKVKDFFELRKKLKIVDANLTVSKKTLIEKAFKESNIDFDKNSHKEELAFVFGFKDEVSPAKAVYQFSKENEKLKILGGFLEGKIKESEEMIVLAQLPAKDELLAKLVGSIASPVSSFVRVLQGNIKGLVTVLSKIKT